MNTPSRFHRTGCRFLPRLEPLEPRMAPAFLPGVPYSTGATPGKPDVADFNLDGKLDVAVGTCFASQVSVLLGNGDGALAPYKEYPTKQNSSQGACPYSTETKDMNNDGVPDIEVANSTGQSVSSVSVLLGVGDGRFRAPIVTPLPLHVFDLVVRDLNHDGFQDAAAVNYTSDQVYVLLGNGDGTLLHVGTLNTGNDPIQIDAGDFNNDGAVDLAVANQDTFAPGSFSAFLGNGDGTFKPKVDYLTGGIRSQAIAVGEFGNDGILDVVVTNTTSDRLSVFKGNGDGTFQAPAPLRVRGYPVGLVVNDFNLDGFNDIAVSSASDPVGSVTIFLNKQSGGFYRHSINKMPQTYWLVSGDLNADGFFDVIASNEAYGKVTVLMNDATWESPSPIPASDRCEARRIVGAPDTQAQTRNRPPDSVIHEVSCSDGLPGVEAPVFSGAKPKRDLIVPDEISLSWCLAWDVLTPGTRQIFLNGGLQ